MGNKKLVIGSAIGYGWNEVRNFVLTLRHSGYEGDICLLMKGKLTKADQREMNKHKVIVKRVYRLFPNVPDVISRMRFTRLLNPVHHAANFVISQHPNKSTRLYLAGLYSSLFLNITCSRYFYYYNYIIKQTYASILLTDVKDVIFQRNPFEQAIDGLHVAVEHTDFTLINEPCNRRWLRILYGEKGVEEVGNNFISCAGTTMGDGASITAYVIQMAQEIFDLLPKIRGGNGLDQGVHNYLLRKKRVAEVHYNLNNNGKILTMGIVPENELNYREGYLCNNDSTVIPVVHQYDRFPQIKLKVIEDSQKHVVAS